MRSLKSLNDAIERVLCRIKKEEYINRDCRLVNECAKKTLMLNLVFSCQGCKIGKKVKPGEKHYNYDFVEPS